MGNNIRVFAVSVEEEITAQNGVREERNLQFCASARKKRKESLPRGL